MPRAIVATSDVVGVSQNLIGFEMKKNTIRFDIKNPLFPNGIPHNTVTGHTHGLIANLKKK
jgi:hypothetical protein